MQPVNLFWTLVSFILTLMVLSYIFGDNPLFRIATYLFIGVAAGYVTVIVIYQVLLPRLIVPLSNGSLILLIPLGLCLLLLVRLIPRFNRLGTLPTAYLVGAGAAVIIGGAVLGTLLGQIHATLNLFHLGAGGANPAVQFMEGIIMLTGILTTLAYFNFSAKAKADKAPERSKFMNLTAKVGQLFIAITLGALFAGVLTAAISAMIERLDFIYQVIAGFF